MRTNIGACRRPPRCSLSPIVQEIPRPRTRLEGREVDRAATDPAGLSPMITTTSEKSSHCPSWPWPMDACTTADDPARRRRRPTRNAIANVTWMLMPIADVICRSSTPARMTMPVFVRCSHSRHDSHSDAEREHHEPRERVAHTRDVQVNEPVHPARPRDADRVPRTAGCRAAAVRGRRRVLVGDDHRDRDRDERRLPICPWFQRGKVLLQAEQPGGHRDEPRHDAHSERARPPHGPNPAPVIRCAC